MTIYAGQIPTAAELDALGGRLANGWGTTQPSVSFTTTEQDCWTVTFTPPTAGTYRFDSYTPYDGVSGEEAKYRLYVGGTERRFGFGKMRASGYVDYVAIAGVVVDLTSTSSVVVKVTGQRTSGTNTVYCRSAARALYIYKVERTASGLINA